MNPKVRYFIPLGIAVTALSFLAFAVGQQVYRQSAYDPQTQIATDAALQIAHLTAPPQLPPTKVDMVKSLSPYLVLYNDEGKAVLGNVQLDGKVPVPPKGVFDYVRSHNRDSVTWEPRAGVRHAIVVVRVDGERRGFVLAGRSLREVDQRTQKLLSQVVFAWLIVLFAVFVSCMIFATGAVKKSSKKS